MATLLSEIDAFLERTGMSPTAFGWSAIKDGCLLPDLKEGRRLWPETEAKVRSFMKENTPKRRKVA